MDDALATPLAPPPPAPRRRWERYLAFVVIAAATAVLFAVDPAQHRILPQCPLNASTGLYCPGCGGTRAAHKLLHGDIAGALRLNMLPFVLAPLLAAALLKPAWFARRTWWTWTILGALLVFGVLRNLPWWPFTLLAPR